MDLELKLELSRFDVRPFEPLEIVVKWKNNRLEHGTELDLITLFIGYNPAWGEDWYLLPWYGIDNNLYYWGTYCVTVAPYKGEIDEEIDFSYTIDLCDYYDVSYIKCGVLVMLTEYKPLRTYKRDYGHGTRVIGLRAEGVDYLLEEENSIIAWRMFYDLFTLYPD